MLELAFLLLPIAAAYGWYMGRNSVKQNDQSVKEALSKKFSTGINFLLSNQQDKAIDYLIEALKVDDDTVEAHFAMANLFRKRGELDRALRVHEHLVHQKHLPSKEKQKAVFELGKDFLSAGLYDRAEAMFTRLLKTKIYGLKSLTFLFQIYQSTSDWKEGIAMEKLVVKHNDTKLLHILANFYCEKATQALKNKNYIDVVELLEKALSFDPKSCRTNWLLAKVFEDQEQYAEACRCYNEIYQQDSEFFPDVIENMHQCYIKLDAEKEFYQFLRKAYEETGSTSLLIKYVDNIEHKHGNKKAQDYMLTALNRRPTIGGFKRFVKLQATDEANHVSSAGIEMIKGLITSYMKIKPRYSCRTCGFNSSTHYWSCPSCHGWEQLKPVRGLEGE
ncbi:MAG: lipopolysaccharide assembly protein LapB [Thalassotalea sp.]